MINKTITITFPLDDEKKVIALEKLLADICRMAINSSEKGIANGVCSLDSNKLISLNNIPSTLTGKTADNATNAAFAADSHKVDGYHASEIVATSTEDDVTASRALDNGSYNHVYQNTSGKLKFATVSCTASAAGTLFAFTGSTTSPANEVDKNTAAQLGHNYNVHFLIIPNRYYRVYADAGTPTNLKWTEWTIGV